MTIIGGIPEYGDMTHRAALVFGPEAMDRIGASRVLVVGLGGVGSWCAEALVRTGVSNLSIVDSDIVCATNINRQVQATSRNVGESKAVELGKRLRDINPSAAIDVRHSVFDASTCDGYEIGTYDYVVDAIDSIGDKVLLVERCAVLGVPVYSSMGAAAKTDPSKIRTGLLSETTVCPLARIMRRNLKKRNITTDIPCVYSVEPPVTPSVPSDGDTGEGSCPEGRRKKRINGSLVHVTAIFGFMLAGMVIRDIAGK